MPNRGDALESASATVPGRGGGVGSRPHALASARMPTIPAARALMAVRRSSRRAVATASARPEPAEEGARDHAVDEAVENVGNDRALVGAEPKGIGNRG